MTKRLEPGTKIRIINPDADELESIRGQVFTIRESPRPQDDFYLVEERFIGFFTWEFEVVA